MRKKTIVLLTAFCFCISLLGIQSSGYAKYTFSGGGSGTSSDPYLLTNRFDLESLRMIVKNGAAGLYFRLACDIDLELNLFEPIGDAGHVFEGVFDGAGHSLTGLYVHTNGIEGSGLFGVVKNGSIQNLYVSGDVWGGTRSGGIVGVLNEGQITNCGSDVQVICDDTSESAGGIAGACLRGQITNCYSTNFIYGGDGTGGIIGTAAGGDAGLLVSNCFSSSNISGKTNSGGIIGEGKFGGIVIENCYNTGTISASAADGHAGGIAGQVLDSHTLINNYYQAGSAAGAVDSAEIQGVEVLTAGQMQTTDFCSRLGNAYIQSPAVNGGYPVLKSAVTKQPAEIRVGSYFQYREYTTEKLDLGVTATGDGTLEFRSSDPSVATVDSSGYAEVHGLGHTSIVITMDATDFYEAAESKTIELYISKATLVPKPDELPSATVIVYGQSLAEAVLKINDTETG